MKVVITGFAKLQLKEIYGYYATEASESVALKIVNKILDEIARIERHPNIGTQETYLNSLHLHHKYLVIDNYKIIFRKEAETLFITDIFDCRQDPKKMEGRNKKDT